MVRTMSQESSAPIEVPPLYNDPMVVHDEEAPCRPSLWKVVAIQCQNALNDKIAQYVLLGLAQVIPALNHSQREAYAHVGAMLLALPLILFMPLAGWVADRYSKQSVLFWCSVAQCAGMAAIAFSFYMNWFWMATGVFFVLATQATFFSTAKGGIVKELVGEKQLSWANSWVQATGLVAIVAGPWFGGALFKWMAHSHQDAPHLAAFWPALFLSFAALVPVLLSTRVRRTPSHSQEKMRWSLLWEHFFYLKDLLKDRTLRLTSFGVAFFWFSATISALMLVQVAQTMTDDRAAQAELSGFLMVWVGLGIAVGSVLVGLVSSNRIELALVPLGGLGMALGSVAVAVPFIALGGWVFNALMFWMGVSSAVFLVPLNAYLQDLVEPAKRGRQLAASGLMDSLGMFFGIIVQYGFLSLGLTGRAGVRLQFVLLGVLCLATAIYVVRIIPQNFLRFVCLALIKLFYRVRVQHGERIPKTGGALLIANHVSYLDAFIVSAACERKVRFIASDQFHKMRFIGPFLTLFDVVAVSPTRAKDAILSVAEAVAGGDLVCIFPEGQITRTGVMNEIRKGFELIARRSHAPVIPVHLDGLWGSVLSFERGRYFTKWPKSYSSHVSVSFAAPEPPETATADWARGQFRTLATEAMAARREVRTRLEVAAVCELTRQPWCPAAVGKHPETRAMLLAQAWTLARQWTDRINADRVLVLSQGYPGIVANLALLLAGFTPVNWPRDAPAPTAAALAELPALGIGAVIADDARDTPGPLHWIHLSAELTAMDSLRLAMKITSIYLLPKRLQAWRLQRQPHHHALEMEAVGWLRPNAAGALHYHALSHREVLVQCEQLSGMDAVREGERVWTQGGFASVEGTVFGLWHSLLQGSVVLSESATRPTADICIGGEKPPAGVRAWYHFTTVPAPASAVACPGYWHQETGRLLSLSLPQSLPPTRTADLQTGTKPGTLGLLLPGYQATVEPSGLLLTTPDGLRISLAGGSLDSEDFLSIASPHSETSGRSIG